MEYGGFMDPHVFSGSLARPQVNFGFSRRKVLVGLGRTVALYYCSSALY